MCGIAGYTGKKSNGMRIKLLTMDNMVRGTHSTGIFVFDKEKSSSTKIQYRGGQLHKAALDAKDFFLALKEDDFLDGNTIVLSHTRQATVGDKTARNAHPFVYGSVAGTHNGWLLSSIKELAKEFNIDHEVSESMEVDSEVIIYLLSTATTAEESIQKITNLKGAMALGYSFKDPKLGRVLCLYKRTSKPLFLGDADNGVYYSSREEGLKLAACSNIRKVADNAFMIFKEGKLLLEMQVRDPHDVDKTIIKEDEGPTSYKTRLLPASTKNYMDDDYNSNIYGYNEQYYSRNRRYNHYQSTVDTTPDTEKEDNPNSLSLFHDRNVLAYNVNQIVSMGFNEFAIDDEVASLHKIEENLMPTLENEKYACISLKLGHSYKSNHSFIPAKNYRVFVEGMPFVSNITQTAGQVPIFINNKSLKSSRYEKDNFGYYNVKLIILLPRVDLDCAPFQFFNSIDKKKVFSTFYTVNVKIKLGWRTDLDVDINLLESAEQASKKEKQPDVQDYLNKINGVKTIDIKDDDDSEWIIDPQSVYLKLMSATDKKDCATMTGDVLKEIQEHFQDVTTKIYDIATVDDFDIGEFNAELAKYTIISGILERYVRQISWYKDEDSQLQSLISELEDVAFLPNITHTSEAEELVANIEDAVNQIIDYLSTKKEYIEELLKD